MSFSTYAGLYVAVFFVTFLFCTYKVCKCHNENTQEGVESAYFWLKCSVLSIVWPFMYIFVLCVFVYGYYFVVKAVLREYKRARLKEMADNLIKSVKA